MSDTNRQSKAEAKLKAHLRAERAYVRKMEDIDWLYDTYLPLVDDFKAGRLVLNGENPFQLEAASIEGEAEEAA